MENRYRTNLKKVFLTDQELVFELRRIGNNINQIARTVNQTHLLTSSDRELLAQGISQLIKEVEKDFDVKCQKLREFYGSH